MSENIEEEDKRIALLKAQEDLFGSGRTNPWGTRDYEVFDRKLRDMSLRELKKLAADVGLMGEWNEAGLRDGLRRRFKAEKHKFNPPANMQPYKINLDQNDPAIKKLFGL